MSETANQPVVYLVDDQADDRRTLQALLRAQGMVCAAFARADAFEAALAKGSAAPACLLLDLCADGAAGPMLFRRLAALGAQGAMPVIFLTAHGDLDTVAEMFRLGAFDFVRKSAPAQQLMQRVAEALTASAAHLEARRSRLVFESLVDRLSVRQRDIAGLLVRGLPNKTIARELEISVRTVEAYRARIFRRLRVRSAIELAVQMSRFGAAEYGRGMQPSH